MLDFFGLPHGRPVPYFSALTTVAEGKGFNAYYPMPFRRRLRMTLTNGSPVAFPCFYQVDYTLEHVPSDAAICTRPSDARIQRRCSGTLSSLAVSKALVASWVVSWASGCFAMT